MRRVARILMFPLILSTIFIVGDTVRSANTCVSRARSFAAANIYHARLSDVAECTAVTMTDLNYRF